MTDRIIVDPSESGSEHLLASASVISLADVRVSRGWSRQSKVCEHKSLVYSSRDRRIECKDCDQPIEAFDAFMTLVRHFDSMEDAARRREHQTKEAAGAVIVRKAAKALDKAWGRKMAPCCPHCDRGLLPEDFERGGSQIGQDFERARRKRPA
ncbi:hypothetical protein [Brevundimonas naejangsanensis]